jgi:hypothetical protein
MTGQTLGAPELPHLVVRPEEPAEVLPVEEAAQEPAVLQGDSTVFMAGVSEEILHAEEVVQEAGEQVHSHTRVAAWLVPPVGEQEEEAQTEVISSVALEEE